MNLLLQSMKLILAIVWTSISFNLYSLPIEAQTNTPRPKPRINNASSKKQFQSRGIPPLPKGAGPRNPCSAMEAGVTALMPVTVEPSKTPGKSSEYWGGYTTQGHPTFWFYVPYAPKNIQPGTSIFTLFNRKNLTEYKANLVITGTPGIVSVSLPNEVEIKPGEWYESQLFLKVSCDNKFAPQTDFASGWVRRDSLITPIKPNSTTQQQLEIYLKDEMWFDALGILAEMKRENTKNQLWDETLKSIGLETIAGKRIVNCCTTRNQ